MFQKKRGKHAQITAFIIIGVVLLILLGLIFYVVRLQAQTPTETTAEEKVIENVLPHLQTYVERCIHRVSLEPLLLLGKQGGSLAPADYVFYNNTKVNYLCVRESPTKACVNALLTRQQMEFQLAEAIKAGITECVDLNLFRAKGARVDEGALAVSVTIGVMDVKIDVDYPINVTQEDKITRVDRFTSAVPVPLGRLYDFAMEITNTEIREKQFDIDDWMVSHNAEILVEKHRPYPDTVYLLHQTGYTFLFALQGSPTVGLPRPSGEREYGCCRNDYDATCFVNALEITCDEIDGVFNPSLSCSCPTTMPQEPERQLAGCAATYDSDTRSSTGPPRDHGESWCQYNTITGNGFDLVGSRHYKHSCINGTELVEECRDFREELCTETTQPDGATKAVCQTNRWQDCAQCATRECCGDTRYRDCHWNDGLTLAAEKKCTPMVSPGLKFWERQGSDVCFKANTKQSCDGMSCPANVVDSAAVLCYKQGDCGDYRNVAGVLSKGGFFETDLFDNPREYVYLDESLAENNRQWILHLPLLHPSLYYQQHTAFAESQGSPAGSIPSFLESALHFLDDLFSIEFGDFLKPFVGEPAMDVVDYAYCDLWLPPTRNQQCEFCAADPLRPCTEYRCKSLGEQCVFDYNHGEPTCLQETGHDNQGPHILLDPSVTEPYYQFVQEAFASSNALGYHLEPNVIPHKPLTLGVITNEPARCKVDYSPTLSISVMERSGYYSIPSFWFGDPSFSTTHRLRFRMPPHLDTPQRILDFLNFTSTSNFSDAVETIQTLYDHYQEDYREKISLYQQLTGQDFLSRIDPLIQSVIVAVNMLVPQVRAMTRAIINEYAEGGYYLFVKCIDRAGNENDRSFFFRFEVDVQHNDTEAPVILAAAPQNNTEIIDATTAFFYLDEPAECRYSWQDRSFETMNHTMDCATSPYELSPVEEGTYACAALLSLVSDVNETTIFVRCKDKPLRIDTYLLRAREGLVLNYSVNQSFNFDPSLYVSLAQPNAINVSADFLRFLGFTIPSGTTDNPIVDLHLFIDNNDACKYAPTNIPYEDMAGTFGQCRVSNQLERGQYACVGQPSLFPRELPALGNHVVMAHVYTADEVFAAQQSGTQLNTGPLRLTFTPYLAGTEAFSVNLLSTEREFASPLQVLLDVTTPASCFYATTLNANQVIPMDCAVSGGVTNCTSALAISMDTPLFFTCNRTMESREYELYVKCAQNQTRQRNVNNQSYGYRLHRGVPLQIVGLTPAGQVRGIPINLTVTLNKNIEDYGITCGFTDNPIFGLLAMDQARDDQFQALLTDLEPGFKRYVVSCKDKLGSHAVQTAVFEVIENIE